MRRPGSRRGCRPRRRARPARRRTAPTSGRDLVPARDVVVERARRRSRTRHPRPRHAGRDPSRRRAASSAARSARRRPRSRAAASGRTCGCGAARCRRRRSSARGYSEESQHGQGFCLAHESTGLGRARGESGRYLEEDASAVSAGQPRSRSSTARWRSTSCRPPGPPRRSRLVPGALELLRTPALDALAFGFDV